jgi:hypothetical protein
MTAYSKPGRTLHQSSRGVRIDMDAMRAQNESSVAVTGRGNDLRMNARGDVLVRGGRIGKTREEIDGDYNQNPVGAVKNVSLKDVQPDVFETPQQAMARLQGDADVSVQTVDQPAGVMGKNRARRMIDKAD